MNDASSLADFAMILSVSEKFFDELIPACKQIEIDYDKQCCGVLSVFGRSKSAEFHQRWTALLDQVIFGANFIRESSVSDNPHAKHMRSVALIAHVDLSIYIKSRIDIHLHLTRLLSVSCISCCLHRLQFSCAFAFASLIPTRKDVQEPYLKRT